MDNNSNKPTLILAVGMIVLLMGGFLFFVYAGTNGQKTGGLRHHFSFRGVYAAASSYFTDAKTGRASIKQKADSFMSSFFDEPGTTASSARYAEAAKRGAGEYEWNSSDSGESGEGNSFERYYEKNYGAGSGGGPDSWTDSDGGNSSYGGAPSGGNEAAQEGAPRAKPRKTPAGPAAPAGARNQASAPRPAFGGPSAGAGAAAPRLYASALPARNGTEKAALPFGGGQARAGGAPAHKLGGMAGSQAKGAGDLNGATEGMRGGAQSSYNSKLAGGASAVAGGSSGGAVPAASGPKSISGGGGSAGAVSGTGAGPGYSAAMPDYGGAALYDTNAADQDLVESVVTDAQTGGDAKYVTADDAKAVPEEGMLKSGAVAGADGPKDADTPDPKDLLDLSPERKLELKKSFHVFLKGIQNRFGAMTDIQSVSCTSTLDLCNAHGVTGSYLSMKTDQGAKLDLGVKYIKTKWRRYTLDFQKPGAAEPAR